MSGLSVEILTLFPEIFDSFLSTSLIKKAVDNSLLSVRCTNVRDYADPPHHRVDDVPYGGGGGMLLKPEPLAKAIEDAKSRLPNAPVVLFSPAGELFSQSHAGNLSGESQLILICGRYEGVDQRIIDMFVDLELSIGDYVLMGGELPAMVVLEATLRLQSNVLGNKESIEVESFSDGRSLEGPHYTRPAVFRDSKVPDVLLSGDHKEIRAWRDKMSQERTKKRRPELLSDE